MLNQITQIVKEIMRDIDGVLGVALLHINGIPITTIGYDNEFWVKTSAFLNNLAELSNFLKSKPRGFDVIFDDYSVVARAGERVVAILVATPLADIEHLDMLAFRLVEEVEKYLLCL
ncbi:hypothetical protein [Pyrobaculum aerophilum]|uniref:Roadblock/LAMTOR2 domain-containing protein n=1 Tax=Pyrobaculum aerophilum TaxID=13773 RepID=A0A371QXZ5_9CREN|nr:hypothetical protein [Pyrobaculum aerophilum]RFA95561.1 hypothetical protein CGL52_12700 [Pyrobaculum aerophilum]RFA98281.1 hypothetical protein CGL51_00950 [Pyrobaculum aerophilum]